MHSAMRAMVDRGHEVTIICRPHSSNTRTSAPDGSVWDYLHPYYFEGVKVIRPPLNQDHVWIREYAREYDPDLLLTHLDLTSLAMQVALDIHKPIAHMVHNDAQLKYWHVDPVKCQLAIFNSDWVAEKEEWNGPQITIHPVVEPDLYRCDKGKKITLVNPTPGKGADTFYKLSRVMPDYEFLTVQGVYGEQVFPPNIEGANYPNVEFMAHTPDIREAFRKTKVILMPSLYESYGRVAVEAACAGIPTIAHPTPGLKEALGDAGIFIDRDDTEAIKEELTRLFSDEVYYRKRSDLALKLADSLDPESEYDRLEEALLVTTEDWKSKETAQMNKMWTSDRRLYKRADGSITENKNEAQSLYVGEGGEIPLEEAVRLGFSSQPAETAEVLLDTKALNAAPENKAVEMPKETKTKKTRKTA